MANLIIKKSASENISIPLTTEKPIARSLAVFKGGQIHYAPLVHSGDSLDSGVKVRIGSTNYALASQLYDPVTYDSSGKEWVVAGTPYILSRRTLTFDGKSCLTSASTVHLTASSSFGFGCDFFIRDFTESQFLCDFNISASRRILLFYGKSSNALVLRLFTSTSAYTDFKTLASKLNTYTWYSVWAQYDNGVWSGYFDGTAFSSVTKAIPEGDYNIWIGASSNQSATNPTGLAGSLSDVECHLNGNTGYFRFGD